jgi:hypothetical protein
MSVRFSRRCERNHHERFVGASMDEMSLRRHGKNNDKKIALIYCSKSDTVNLFFLHIHYIMSSIAGASGAAAGGELEERIDLSAETDAKLEQSATLAQAGQIKEALALLAALEKRCRVGNDSPSLVRVCEASLQYCKDAGDDELLITTLETLSTKRSQKTQAVRALVHKAMPWCVVDKYTPIQVPPAQYEAREKLVVALRTITDGKLFLEAERARLTRALAIIKVGTVG